MISAKKIRIVAFGRIKEPYIQEGVAGFAKRLAPFCRLELVELKDEGPAKEAKRLDAYIGPGTYILDVDGKQFTSEEFSKFVEKQDGQLTLVVGGAEGIDASVKKRAPAISLSRMTFTHEMSRLFLMEQVYRAFMIGSNRKYHK